MGRILLAVVVLALVLVVLAGKKDRTDKAMEKYLKRVEKLKKAADEIKSQPDKLSQASKGIARFLDQVAGAADIIENFELRKKLIDVLLEDGLITADDVGGVLGNLLDDVECPYDTDVVCDPSAPYRELDGKCNNLDHPLWGSALTPFPRFLKPAYDDGVGTPRTTGVDGSDLPSARDVSWLLGAAESESVNPVATLMHMSLGQVLDHDLDATPISKLQATDGSTVNIACDCADPVPESDTEDCFPIPVSPDDPVFGDREEDDMCLSFVRSASVPEIGCNSGLRAQLNQITSHMDLSMVYGSGMEGLIKVAGGESGQTLEQLFPTRGKLAVTKHPFNTNAKDLLPRNPNDGMCNGVTDEIQCFVSGDGRTNEQVGLASLHTIFMREHNRLEEQLFDLNPEWSGVKLFNETRKLLTAKWQAIVYKEYLPVVFGVKGFKTYIGKYKGYDDSLDDSIFNEFATVVFRVAHSMIPNTMDYTTLKYDYSEATDLTDAFFNVKPMYDTDMFGDGSNEHGIDCAMRANLYQSAEQADPKFSKAVGEKLFSASDLASLNIQRARDHGLPGYFVWRKKCGLEEDLSDIPESRQHVLLDIYSSAEDIDPFVGVISETHIDGGLIGPTAACVQGEVFRRLRAGDRFWYENEDKVVGFTEDQRSEINKATLARMLCDNLDYMESTQLNVNLKPRSEIEDNLVGDKGHVKELKKFYDDDDNHRRPCDQIPTVDLQPWDERVD